MTGDQWEVRTALDALRCLFLAREAQRRNQPESARRWEQKAREWLERSGLIKAPPPKEGEPIAGT